MLVKKKKVYFLESENQWDLHDRLEAFYNEVGSMRCRLVTITSNRLGYGAWVELDYEEGTLD